MTERGRVVKLDGSYAFVAFDRTARCDRCRNCVPTQDGHHATALVKNTLGANVGDFVDVSNRPVPIALSSLIYLLPFAFFAAGLTAGYMASKALAIALGVVGFAVGLAVAIPLDRLVLRRALRSKMLAFALEDGEITNDGNIAK